MYEPIRTKSVHDGRYPSDFPTGRARRSWTSSSPDTSRRSSR